MFFNLNFLKAYNMVDLKLYYLSMNKTSLSKELISYAKLFFTDAAYLVKVNKAISWLFNIERDVH